MIGTDVLLGVISDRVAVGDVLSFITNRWVSMQSDEHIVRPFCLLTIALSHTGILNLKSTPIVRDPSQ